MAALAGLLAGAIPLALGGESAGEAGGNGTAIAVVSVVSLVAGYLLLFLLWRYVFSAKARARRREPPD
ncbi:MAG: hypothetical protein QOK11_3135 [Pseudonocardiales bacterium]|jgi:hypothetical protein|nr:hypothetical protein [Pseudonocardiales bacterium]MEA2200958.1 hypothetical protein [Solirubrobacteraceae bacterium]